MADDYSDIALPAGEAATRVKPTSDYSDIAAPSSKATPGVSSAAGRPAIPSDKEAARWFAEYDKRVNLPQTGNTLDVADRSLPMQERIRRLQLSTAERQRQWDEEQAFKEGRTLGARATGAANFAASMPVRAFTQGQHGIGTLVGGLDPEAGAAAEQSEMDFARANQAYLEPIAKAGELSLAVPPLAAMGAPAGGMAATLRAAARTTPGVRGVLNPAVPKLSTEAQAYAPTERLKAAQAFEEEGVPAFAPAFTSKGTARTARTIEEAPLVGGTITVPKREVEMATAARQQALAQEAGAAASPEDAGLIAQRALQRYRTARLEELERPVLEDLGVPTATPTALARPGTVLIDRPSQLNTAAMTPEELELARTSQISFPRSERATIQNMSPADLERIISSPARDTSFTVKQAALYKIADDAMPALFKENNARNPNLIPTRLSGAVASGLAQAQQSARIQGGALQGRFGTLVRDLANPRSNFTIEGLRAARTELGRALAEGNTLDASLSRTQLKQLYGAVTGDIERGLVAVAARARQQANAGTILPQIADQADRALYLTQRADRYTRASMDRMDRFMGVLGADTLEQASRRLGSYMKENTQNVQALETLASSLRPEEWRSVLGYVVGNLGKLPAGAKEAEGPLFSFERFATDWNKISQNTRVRNVFRKGLGDDVIHSLDNLGTISERMKRYETTRNYSGSGYVALGGAGLAAWLNPATLPFAILGTAGVGLTGKVLTSPAFAKWVSSGLAKTQARVGSPVTATRIAMQRSLGRLVDFAASELDPEVKAALITAANGVRTQLAEHEGAQGHAAGGAVADVAPPSFPHARKASDGRWYIPDRKRPGKYLEVRT